MSPNLTPRLLAHGYQCTAHIAAMMLELAGGLPAQLSSGVSGRLILECSRLIGHMARIIRDSGEHNYAFPKPDSTHATAGRLPFKDGKDFS